MTSKELGERIASGDIPTCIDCQHNGVCDIQKVFECLFCFAFAREERTYETVAKKD